MTINKLFFLFGLLFASCNPTVIEKDNYPKDKTVSDINGSPKDSLTFYLPIVIQRDTQKIKTKIDTFKLNWYSSALYSAKEPILFNYYQGHDIYRFLWLRSFHRPVVFSLSKEGDNVQLTTKELNKQPEFMEMTWFSPPIIQPNGEILTIKSKNNNEQFDSIIKADRKASIVFNQTKQLTKKEWTEFETLLNNCSFWTTKPFDGDAGLDGSEWIIEAHLKNKYWFVNKWSPKDNFKKAGEYLIDLGGLKEEIY